MSVKMISKPSANTPNQKNHAQKIFGVEWRPLLLCPAEKLM